jgi:hypothetical protein
MDESKSVAPAHEARNATIRKPIATDSFSHSGGDLAFEVARRCAAA